MCTDATEAKPKYLTAAQTARVIGLDERTTEELAKKGFIQSEVRRLDHAIRHRFPIERLEEAAITARLYKLGVKGAPAFAIGAWITRVPLPSTRLPYAVVRVDENAASDRNFVATINLRMVSNAEVAATVGREDGSIVLDLAEIFRRVAERLPCILGRSLPQ